MTLETLQTLYTVFLVLSIVFFILSIVLFFVFDIRKIFSIKTGRAVRKSMQELNEINRNEDNRNRKKYKGHSMQLSKELTAEFDRMNGGMTGDTRNTGDVEDESLVTEQLESNATVVLKQEGIASNETEVLIAPVEDGKDVLETSVVMREEPKVIIGRFNIVDRKEVRFADELI